MSNTATEVRRTLQIARELRRTTGKDCGGRDRSSRTPRAASPVRGDHSPFYREHVGADGIRSDNRLLDGLPPTTKQQLMGRFDDWVTEPGLRRAAIEEFVADPARVGELFSGRYAVWTTS